MADENEANEIIHNASAWYYTEEYMADQAREIEQLKAEISSMRPIVEAVATPRRKNTCDLCTYPYASSHGKERRHTPDCPVLQARAYVAAHPATGEGE